MDDELGDVLEILRPENLSNLSKQKVKAIHQILPEVELREVSQSLKNAADVERKGSRQQSVSTHETANPHE